MKFRKLLSGVLACALVVTSAFTGNVTTVKAADAAPSPIASYKFNVSSDDAQPSLGEVEALTLGSASAATVGADDYIEGRSGIVGDKAVNLNGKFGLRLPQDNIGADYTVSMWVKRTADMANNFMPILWLGSEADGYIAAAAAWHADAPATTTSESIVWGGGLTGAEEPHFTLAKDQWEMLTIAQSGSTLSVYQNGKLVKSITKAGLLEALNGEGRKIYIGVNPYMADGLFPGVIDDVYVYNKKLTDNQIFDLYMKDVSLETLGVLGQNESAGCIKDNLTFPEKFKDVNLTWTSQDTDKIDNDGTVKAWDGSEVTLTMKAALSENPNWSKNFTVRLAKKVTVEYVEKGKETLNTATAYFKAADSYTYELTAGDKVWTDETTKKIYVCLENESTLQTDNDTAKITLVYTEDAVETVDTKIPAMTTRINIIPEFPKTVKATFTSGEQRDVNVVWNEAEIAAACKTDGVKTITGGVGAKSVTVQLTVEDKKDYLIADYSFDETDITNGWADGKGGANAVKDGTGDIAVVPGLKGNAIELPGGAKGTAAVKLADDLLKIGENKYADDFTVSMFIKNPGNGNSFAMSLLGDGNANYLGFIYRTGGNGNAVQLECKKAGAITGGCTVGGQAKKDVWEHFAIVVNGNAGTTAIYRNGELLTSGSLAFMPSSMTQQRNFLGRSEWGDNDFNGIYDEFKVYKTALEPSEIQELCDEVLYTEQMKKAKTALQELTTWDGKKVDKDNVVDDLKLPSKAEGEGVTVTWSSSNEEVINTTVTPGDGVVTQPYGDGAEDANVTLTATIKIGAYKTTDKVEHTVKVPKREGADKKPLRHAVSAAQDYYDAAKQRNVYVTSSLDTLSQTIKEANTALNTVMTDKEITQMIAKLEQGKKLTPKSLNQLQNLLSAWYPLDVNAKDASGNGLDGECSSEKVTYTKDKGATFDGEKALTGCVKLPEEALTKLSVSDQMTFSFWASDSQGSKSNAFSIGSGDLFGGNGSVTNGKVYAKFFHVNTHGDNGTFTAGVNTAYWSLHKDVTGPAAEKDTWHLYTGVLSGKTLTFYVDGDKIGATDTEATMTEIWNAEPATRGVYIGNSAYGNQPAAKADAGYTGSIRDVRIYNAALTEEQVGYIQAYGKAITVEYAKADVKKALEDLDPTLKSDGSYDMDIIQTNLDDDGKLALPSTAYDGKATVAWAATGEGADAIDTTTNVVTIPAAGTIKEFTLTATITVDDITGASSQGTLVYNCRAYYKNENLNTKPLTDLYNKLAAYPAEDYTKASYTEFQKTLNDVRSAIPLLQTDEQVNEQIEILNTAAGKLVDISELRSKIETLETELGDLNEDSYSEASWEALQEKLKAAKIVLAQEDASEADITAEKAKLPEKATDDLKLCGSKKPLEDAIAEAERLSTYKEAYDNWSTVEEALKTAKAELSERLESYEEAATALNDVIDALVINDDHKLTGTDKETLGKKLTDAKAENLTKDNYTKATWDNYQDALDRLESVLENEKATKDEAEEAAEALETARAELTTISSKTPTAPDKQKLADAVAEAEAEDVPTADYTEDSVAAYTAAKEKLTALADRVAAGDKAVTTDDIETAVTAFETARTGLEPTEDQKLTDDDKTALTQAVADAKALKLTYYTADSKKVYQDALADLEALTKKNNATKNEVKAAEEALAKAKADLTLTEEQTPTPEKKEEFAKAYKAETDRDLKAADYTEESWARYQAALAAAADLSERLSQENNKVAKDEIDAVVTELKDAYEALAKNAPNTDKTALNTAITAAGKLVKNTYTTSTWNAFQTALTTAKNIYAKEDATQTEIDNAEKDLTAKQRALKKAVTKITITEKVTGNKAPKIAAGKKVTLKATVAPADANSSVTWSVDSKSKKYASVSKSGVVTTKKAGAGKKATIIATATDGSKKTGKITITIMKNAVTKVTLKAAKKNVKAGKSVTVKATVKTNGKKANKTLSWKSSNTKYATVNSKGKVTTKKAGKGKTVTITATATDGTGKKASVKIKITK